MARVLDLPAEILHMVLVEAILKRSLVRALRLKLVCRRFRDAFQPALFASRRLDHRIRHQLQAMAHWPIRQHHGADKMWHDYTMHLIRTEKISRTNHHYLLQIVNAFCAETGAGFDEILSAISWLVLDQATNMHDSKCRPMHDWSRPTHPKSKPLCAGLVWRLKEATYSDRIDLGTNLLSLAAYLDQEPLARRLLSEGCCPSKPGFLPSAMETAAFAGNVKILKLFQEHASDYGPGNMPDRVPASRQFDPSYRCKVDPGAIYGAALRGDLDMLKLALYPPSRSTPESDEIMGEAFGQISVGSLPAQYLHLAACVARTWEIFQYISSALGIRVSNCASEALELHVEFGNIDMVKGLLNAGRTRPSRDTLHSAVRGCHEDVVDFLLERGVVPDAQGHVLNAAVSAGSLTLLKKLIAHGARVDGKQSRPYQLALVTAIELEHTDMIRYLLSLRKPSAAFRKQLIKNLRVGIQLNHWDLNSMLEFVWNDFGGCLSPKKTAARRSSPRPSACS
ncbi:ankyrin repeat-containing domain protein [Immersiella caudata]|uniref:Ankyrin repeat-containing domain protein n=1 Tax=Immersiella caudata TaxID=314043 RepID=A0AA39WYL7_9PEZI|nr:ankyrin repeat-containing domain protein [Immersiella caudata]